MAEMRWDPLMIFNEENTFVISFETYVINWLWKMDKKRRLESMSKKTEITRFKHDENLN